MGRDFDAFTIIGIRLPTQNFTFYKKCVCGYYEDDEGFCRDCNAELTFTDKKYEIYKEIGEDGGDFENYFFICVEKYSKEYREDRLVKCPFTFEQLIEKRDEMKKKMENMITAEQFDLYFGIYTVTEYSY